jgi:hypothetical protein
VPPSEAEASLFILSKKGQKMDLKEVEKEMQEEVEETPAADFFLGILLMAGSAAVCYVSWKWPRPTGLSSAPALFPFLIAFSMFFMSLSVFITALKNRGYQKLINYLRITHLKQLLPNKEFKLAILALSTTLVYMIVILNLLPFEIGTFIYVAGSLWIFWRDKIYKILILSASITAFYSLIFKYFFNLTLPGAGM